MTERNYYKDIVNNKVDFIQIGFNKTGTTFLEKSVYKAHPDIECYQIAGNVELERLFNDYLIGPLDYNYNKNEFKNKFNAIYKKSEENKKLFGLMYEALTFQYSTRINISQIIERLYDIFPDAKIIIFIRNQNSWLISHYSQYIKSGGKLTFHDFIECILCNSVYDGMAIDWYPLVQTIYDYYPREKVFIGLFEELAQSPQGVANNLFDFLNIPRIPIEENKVNPSLNYWGLKCMRVLNKFVNYDCGTSPYSFFRDLNGAEPTCFKRMQHTFIYRVYKPKALFIAQLFSNILKSNKKLSLSDMQKMKVMKKYHDNNIKLSKLIDLDLKKYNYP